MIMDTINSTIVALSKDKSHVIYNIKGFPTAVVHGLANLYRQTAYMMAVGAAPVGFRLLGVTRISDISPQFKETTRDIGLNISNIKITPTKDNIDIKTVTLAYKGKIENVLTAGMLNTNVPDIVIMNPDLKILTVSTPQEVDLEIEFLYSKGVLRATDKYMDNTTGTTTSSRVARLQEKMGKQDFIRLTANFSPIKLFRYQVFEDGEPNGKSELLIEIKTNGTLFATSVMPVISQYLEECKLTLSNLLTLRVGEIEESVNWVKEVEKVEAKDTPKQIPDADNMIEILSLDVDTYNTLKETYNINSLKELMERGDTFRGPIKEKIIKALEEVGLRIYENK